MLDYPLALFSNMSIIINVEFGFIDWFYMKVSALTKERDILR